ncbi:ABC transporter substrate-binding protein [Butyricicoccus pullicaecorum]|uniref:ABC transporter substrate-binding protein n=2 Tax=Butyricicoccus pullicaecorum TaxID=501571 RepID=A0A1Y4LHD5_9FIRM|nr:ABC transporter substrate-binding protein [Butyricicoccus pullicaecorum]
MMKKYTALLLASTMMLTALTGCGGAGGSDAQTQEADGPISLEFWHSMGGTTGEVVQEIVDEFNASQDDIHVDCIYQGDYTTGGTKIQAAVSAGNGPAIAQIEVTRVGTYAAADCLLDLTPYAEADTEFDVDDLYPGVMDYSYYEDKLVSLPNGRSVPVMYYNVDALKAAGFDEAPATWDELRAAAAATTDPANGVYGYGCPLGDSWYYLALMLTAGGQVYNDEGNNIGFNNESGTKPLQLWLDMVNDGSLYLPDGDDYSSLSALRNAFMAGICNITMQSSSQYRSLADNSDFEVGVAFIPKDVTYAAIPGGSNLVSFGTNLSEEEKQAVWTFMKYMCSGDVAGKYAAMTGYLPTSDAAVNSEIYQETLAQYPYLDIAVDQLEYFVKLPFDEAYAEIKDNVIGKYVQEVIIAGMSPEEAVQNMYDETAAFYA